MGTLELRSFPLPAGFLHEGELHVHRLDVYRLRGSMQASGLSRLDFFFRDGHPDDFVLTVHPSDPNFSELLAWLCGYSFASLRRDQCYWLACYLRKLRAEASYNSLA